MVNIWPFIAGRLTNTDNPLAPEFPDFAVNADEDLAVVRIGLA
jgi:hypothetical protein